MDLSLALALESVSVGRVTEPTPANPWTLDDMSATYRGAGKWRLTKTNVGANWLDGAWISRVGNLRMTIYPVQTNVYAAVGLDATAGETVDVSAMDECLYLKGTGTAQPNIGGLGEGTDAAFTTADIFVFERTGTVSVIRKNGALYHTFAGDTSDTNFAKVIIHTAGSVDVKYETF